VRNWLLDEECYSLARIVQQLKENYLNDEPMISCIPLSYKVLTQVTEACLTTRSLNVSDCDLDINGGSSALEIIARLKELESLDLLAIQFDGDDKKIKNSMSSYHSQVLQNDLLCLARNLMIFMQKILL